MFFEGRKQQGDITQQVGGQEESIVMTSRSIKQFVAAGATALLFGGAALGIASAQQTPTPNAQATPNRPAGTPGQQGAPRQDQRQDLLNRVAGKLGVPVDRLQQAFTDARRELGIPDRPPGGPGGPGHHGPGRGGPGFGGPGFDFMAVAQAVNLQPDQLRQELAGKSLTDVARAHNVDPATVANALKAQAGQRIDQAAAAGRIPADQVAAAKQQANQRIDELMTRQFPAAGQEGRGGPGRPFGPGPQGPGQPGGTPGPRT